MLPLTYLALLRGHADSRVPFWSPRTGKTLTLTVQPQPSASEMARGQGTRHTRAGSGRCRCVAGRREGSGLALSGDYSCLLGGDKELKPNSSPRCPVV